MSFSEIWSYGSHRKEVTGASAGFYGSLIEIILYYSIMVYMDIYGKTDILYNGIKDTNACFDCSSKTDIHAVFTIAS